MIDNWIEVELKDVADYINGRAFKPTEWEEKGIPIIRIQNLNNPQAKFNYTTKKFEKKYLVKNKDLLFAWSASLGAYIWNGDNAWLNQHIFKVNCKPFIEKYFLYYFLDKITKELYSKTHGSGMVHVTKSKFVSTLIPLPPLPEQRAIVARIEKLFSRLDKGVETLLKVKDQLKVYRQAVLKWAFEGKLTAEWRAFQQAQGALPSAEELLEQIKAERERQYQNKLVEWQKAVKEWEANGKKDKKPIRPKKPRELPLLTEEELAELPKLPERWVWIRLGEITLGVEYGTSLKSQKNGKVPVLRMGNIKNFRFDWDDLVFTNNDDEINKCLLKKGDVLFNRTNSPELVGKTAVFKEERKAIFAGYLIRINQIQSLIDSDYLNYYLNSIFARNYGNKVKTDGVNQSNINGNKLIHYPLPFCNLLEQQAIVQKIEIRLSVADKLEQIIDETLQKAEALRQSILKKAFEGKLLSEAERETLKNDPQWEPAEKLLERIKAEKEKQEMKNNKKKRK